MTNDIILLKNTCEKAENDLKGLSMQLLTLCETTLNQCSTRINSFGEVKGMAEESELIDICVKYIKETQGLSYFSNDEKNYLQITDVKSGSGEVIFDITLSASYKF